MRKNKQAATTLLGKCMEYIFSLCGILAVGMAIAFTLFILVRGLPAFLPGGPSLFGTVWNPAAGSYGLLGLTLGTIYISSISILLATPFAVFCALFLSKEAPPFIARWGERFTEIWGTLPSVVFGLLGVVWVVPFIQNSFGLTHGYTLLAAIFTLSMLVYPRLVGAFHIAFSTVPKEIELAGFAMGATKIETLFFVSLRHASYALLEAVIMQLGIISGESLLIIMVAGNVAQMPVLLGAASTLASVAAGEAYNAGGELQEVLFGICLLLLGMVTLLFSAVRTIARKRRRMRNEA